ncbi:tyrosine-type recombinase/integrase [Demequina pelophila]|uniref:tyrosine-type recombinase/integrase n=1 Tax=Demequina pelophila TaxID=1638984 RepID=UPI0007804A61|nr:site-specific integrase [Demequina pelophila]
MARFRDHDGRTRVVTASGRSRSAAEAELLRRLRERSRAGGRDVSSSTRVDELARVWLAEVDESDRAHSTIVRYRLAVRRHVVPRLGGLRVSEVTTARVDRALRDIADDVGPATARLARTCLSNMFGLAARHDAIVANPVREARTIAPTRAEPRALDADEVRELRAAVRADDYAVACDLPLLVDLLLATGCRVGEVLALRWSDVDLEVGHVTIDGTVVRTAGGLVRQERTKGGRARVLVLPPRIVATLLERRVDGLPSPVILPAVTMGYREVTTVNKQWRSFRRRDAEREVAAGRPARFDDLKLHTLRKTVATRLERDGGLEAAAEQLGHAGVAVTARHYVERAVLAADQSAVLDTLLE